MLDRGLRRRFDPLVEREARAAAESHGARPGPPRPPRPADVHRRPADRARLRRRDQRGAARLRADPDLGAHRRRRRARQPGSAVDREAHRRGTSVYVPGKVEPMLPEALSNDACSLVPHQDRLAVTVELDFEGAKVARTAFHRSAHPLRRAAGLPARGPRLRGRASGPRRRGRGRWRPRARWRRRSTPRGPPAARSPSSRSSRSSTSPTRATSRRSRRPRRPSRTG